MESAGFIKEAAGFNYGLDPLVADRCHPRILWQFPRIAEFGGQACVMNWEVWRAEGWSLRLSQISCPLKRIAS
jgi:hypothetical protein